MTDLNPTLSTKVKKVLDFWFKPNHHKRWFAKSDEFDCHIREQFFDTWQQAQAGECADWRNTPLGRLAEVIVLDQFSRNLMRDKPESFTQDGMALVLAQEAIKQSEFSKLSQDQRSFMLMPFMHSESPKIHQQALQLFTQLGKADSLDFEKQHKAIIDRFGRYPHRNAILGRTSTPEEIKFLQQDGSSF